jgi:hypothetical protein
MCSNTHAHTHTEVETPDHGAETTASQALACLHVCCRLMGCNETLLTAQSDRPLIAATASGRGAAKGQCSNLLSFIRDLSCQGKQSRDKYTELIVGSHTSGRKYSLDGKRCKKPPTNAFYLVACLNFECFFESFGRCRIFGLLLLPRGKDSNKVMRICPLSASIKERKWGCSSQKR